MNSLKILLADDDKLNLMLIERHLSQGLKKYEKYDFQIFKAFDGKEALEVVNQETYFDLILLDWEMPEIDGIDVLRILKANPVTSEIPVIMVTSKKICGL